MIVLYVLALGSFLPYLMAASLVTNSNASDDIDKAVEFSETVEKEREALSERDQAVLEAIVDEAIRQEELLRLRRTSAISKPADDRFSGYEHHEETVVEEYGPPPIPTSYKDKSFSLWSFKKMVLNALLQAIKAIKGGVIALTGQIVKVKGHLVAAKGKLLETKGDAITEFGKHLATKALLTPVHVSNYDHNTPAPTPPAPVYAAPAPYPAALSHSSYGSGSHSADYVGPPPSSYGSNNQHFNPAQLSHQYLPPPPSGFSSPSGPSYSNSYGGSSDHWNQRSTHDSGPKRSESYFPEGFHAGLIVLKPLKALEPRNVYKTPKAFSKSSNSRNDDETATVKPKTGKNVKT